MVNFENMSRSAVGAVATFAFRLTPSTVRGRPHWQKKIVNDTTRELRSLTSVSQAQRVQVLLMTSRTISTDLLPLLILEI